MARRQTITITLLVAMLHTMLAIQVVQPPVDHTVQEGVTVDLNCVVENKNNVQVHWLREQKYLTFDYNFYDDAINPRYSILSDGDENTKFILRIDNVQLSDAGTYQCGYYYQQGGQPSPTFFSATLSVTKAPSLAQEQTTTNEISPRCSVEPADPELDDTVSLICVSDLTNPAARLTWARVGRGDITGQADSRNSVARTLRGELNGVTFTCRQDHLSETSFCSVTPLQILPSVRIEPPRVIDRIGQGALFTCIAFGIPDMLMYQFFFNDIPVEEHPDGNRLRVSDDFRQLQITDVVADDNGAIIRCDVQTTNGLNNSATAQLLVEGVTNVTFAPTVTSNVTDDPIRYVGALTRYHFNTIIIVIASLIGQFILVIIVYLLHRSLKGKEEEKKKMMAMEWKGVTQSQRRANEIVPKLADLNTAPRRYTQLMGDDVQHPRYQDLGNKSPDADKLPSNVVPLEMGTGVYEGVATSHSFVEAHVPSNPSPKSSPARTPKVSSSDSPKHPPPRYSQAPGSPRVFDQGTIPASRPPAALPNSPGAGGVPPNAFQENEDGGYSRPTSNAYSIDGTMSYQGSVINHLDDSPNYDEPPIDYAQPESNYDEPPIEYAQPESETVYEVPPDGYVLPDPRNIEDPDLDDYELPPTEDQLGYVPV